MGGELDDGIPPRAMSGISQAVRQGAFSRLELDRRRLLLLVLHVEARLLREKRGELAVPGNSPPRRLELLRNRDFWD
jgi:hypothetical protein